MFTVYVKYDKYNFITLNNQNFETGIQYIEIIEFNMIF
jgi:hypothetical protein